MTMNVADSWYCVPLGQEQGVPETAEHAERAETSAGGATIANWNNLKRRCILPWNKRYLRGELYDCRIWSFSYAGSP